MFQRRPRSGRFRRHSNGRSRPSHANGHSQTRLRSNSFSNSQPRNNFRPTQSAEKLLDKYTTLAKEAKSSGDESLCENYLQHADHFIRVIEDKNRNKINSINKLPEENKSLPEENKSPPEENKSLPENNLAEQEDINKNKI
jgi:hypothetical protein